MKDLISSNLLEGPARPTRSVRGGRPRSRAFARVLDTAQRLDAAKSHSDPHVRSTPDELTSLLLGNAEKTAFSRSPVSQKASNKKKTLAPKPVAKHGAHAEVATMLTLRAEAPRVAAVVEQSAEKLGRLQDSSPLGTHARLKLQERTRSTRMDVDADLEEQEQELLEENVFVESETLESSDQRVTRITRVTTQTQTQQRPVTTERVVVDHGLGTHHSSEPGMTPGTERVGASLAARPPAWAEQFASKFQASLHTTARGGVFELGLREWTGEDISLRLQVTDGQADLICEFHGVEPTSEVQRALEEMRRVLEEAGLDLGDVTYERRGDKESHTQDRRGDEPESSETSETSSEEVSSLDVSEVPGRVYVVV